MTTRPEGPAPRHDGRPRRSLAERALLTLVALVLAGGFAAIGLAAFAGGEAFLGAMGLLGALMTLWVGALTALRS